MIKDRVERRISMAVGSLALLSTMLTGCFLRESRVGIPITIVNDTDASVTIWIEHEGEEFRPEDGDPRLDPGESAIYGLDSDYATIDLDYACTDGDIVARRDDGSEIRIPPPICDDETIVLSEALPAPS
jgi:hypothetical protein